MAGETYEPREPHKFLNKLSGLTFKLYLVSLT